MSKQYKKGQKVYMPFKIEEDGSDNDHDLLVKQPTGRYARIHSRDLVTEIKPRDFTGYDVLKYIADLIQKEESFKEATGYTPHELIARAVESPPKPRWLKIRWSFVGRIFNIGDIAAGKLCDYFNFDPQEDIKSIHDAEDEETN